MDLRDFVRQTMELVRQRTMNMIQGVTQEQLRFQPHPDANHAGFLLFHIFRTEDRYFHDWVTTSGEVWERGGWSRRWQLPSPPSNSNPIWTIGNSWTIEEVRGWQPPPLKELLEYGEAVRVGAFEVVRDLDLARLDEVPRPERPDWSVAYYLRQGSLHEAAHQGQMDYALGILRASRA